MRRNLVPDWCGTLEQMIRHGTRVAATCRACGRLQRSVDLDAMVALLGRDGSLWDRQPPCEVGDCHGRVYYRAHAGGRLPWALLYSDPALQPYLPIAALCGGWTGATT